MRRVLIYVIILQSFLFGNIENIDFKESIGYKDYSYKDIEFHTKNTYGSFLGEYRFLGLIIKDLKIEKLDDGFNIFLSIDNYSDLIGSVEVYDKNLDMIKHFEINCGFERPDSLLSAIINFYKDVPYTLGIANFDKMKNTEISFTLPSKEYVVKVSLNSEIATFYNYRKLILNKVVDDLDLEIDNETLLQSFIKSSILDKLKGNDISLSSVLVNIFESMFSSLVKSNVILQVKDILDDVINFGNNIGIIHNIVTFSNIQIGPTIYINLSGLKNKRGFWGSNEKKDIRYVFDTTPVYYLDVPLSSEFYTAVKYLHDIVAIKENTYFEPERKINRAEMLKIVLKSRKNLPEVCQSKNNPNEFKNEYRDWAISVLYEKKFSDVKSEDWFAPYVWCAYEAKILDGYVDGTFKPSKNVSLSEAFKLISNGLKDRIEIQSNKDIKNKDWWYDYKEYFRGIDEIDKLINKLASIELNRGEVAQLIHGICNLERSNICK